MDNEKLLIFLAKSEPNEMLLVGVDSSSLFDDNYTGNDDNKIP
ncbi:MAG: hypothetical protein N4A37_11995 [Prolixibacteraceae bacterium]|jgi:hypothetical protein|nr:hypothetical protein [Prolixibacteraceae bacterium]